MLSPSKQSPSQLSSNLTYISRAKHLPSTTPPPPLRPWSHLLNHHLLSPPRGIPSTMTRVKTNLKYFQTNFTALILFILFLSLLYHPISLIVFILDMVPWFILYFKRNEPVVLLNRTVDDRFVLGGLLVLTVVSLALTGVTGNVVGSLVVGVGVVLFYSVFRRTDDLYLDEEGTV